VAPEATQVPLDVWGRTQPQIRSILDQAELGDGIPLFPSGTSELPLRLAKSEAKTGGALHLVYER